MMDVVQQRREKLVAELAQVEQLFQQAASAQQRAGVQAERLRGAIALCDELRAEQRADKPAALQQ